MHTTVQSLKSRRTIILMAVFALFLSTLGVLAATPAYAAADTPDGKKIAINSGGTTHGWISWNDYKNSDPSVDYDNIWVQDAAGNNTFICASASYKNEFEEACHDSSSGHSTISFDINVENGDSVKVSVYVRKGAQTICYCGTIYFYE